MSQTGQVVNVAHAARAEQILPTAANDYAQLLEAVFLLHRLPAWGTTLGARVNALPKVHVMDTGVGGWMLGIGREKFERREPAALTELGHLIETFAVNEILKQVGWSGDAIRSGHYRTHDGDEVDLVLEASSGDVLAFEIRSGELVRPADARPLGRLRDKLGDRFRVGIVLHTGGSTRPIGDRIVAAPAGRTVVLSVRRGGGGAAGASRWPAGTRGRRRGPRRPRVGDPRSAARSGDRRG